MTLTLFRRALADLDMAGRRRRVLVAVSGGADSVCLLDLFLQAREQAGLRLAVVHYNHRLRGKDSEGDEDFVRRLTRLHDLPFLLGKAPSGGTTADPGRSLQEAAREVRLTFLLTTAGREKYHHVALGHTADDQAETMLMRLLGRSGPAGLGGIPPASHGGMIVHPLLDIRRCDIESRLAERGISFRQDRSNRSVAYLRNRLRGEVLPLLEGYNPKIVERLGDLARLLRRDNHRLEEEARVLARGILKSEKGTLIPPGILTREHPALLARLLLQTLRSLAPGEQDFGSRHLDSLQAGIGSSRSLRWDLPGGVTANLDNQGLFLSAGSLEESPASPFSIPLRVPGSAADPAALGAVRASVKSRTGDFSPLRLPGLPWRAVLDWDRVSPPLEVRSRLPGDRYRPLGSGGSRKLKKVLIDAKVPRRHRDRLPVVCDSRGILWAAGLPPAHHARVTPATKKLLHLRCEIQADDHW